MKSNYNYDEALTRSLMKMCPNGSNLTTGIYKQGNTHKYRFTFDGSGYHVTSRFTFNSSSEEVSINSAKNI